MSDVMSTQAGEPAEPVSIAELSAFCGKAPCPKEWEAYRDNKSSLAGFSGWAAFFGAQWFLCRRLYWQALVALILEAGVPIFLLLTSKLVLGEESYREHYIALPLSFAFSFLLARIFLGFWANVALYKKAVNEIRRIDALNLDNEFHLKMIASAGSLNIGALVFLYIGMVVMRILYEGMS